LRRERTFNGVQKPFIFEWLFDEIYRAGFYCMYCRSHTAVAGYDDDGNSDAQLGEALLKFQASHFGHFQIQEQTSATQFRRNFQKGSGGGVQDAFVSRHVQEPLERSAHRRIVIHDMHKALL
jgi:hypothetical protein